MSENYDHDHHARFHVNYDHDYHRLLLLPTLLW
jgi:hypothetical protein